MRLLLAAFLVALTAPITAQTPYYVDSAASPGGTGSIGRPFRKLTDVEPLLGSAPDVVLIKRGSVFVTTDTFDVPSNTRVSTYGAGPKPVIDMHGAEATIGVRTKDVTNVLIEDLVVRRANRGFHHLGGADHVRLVRCEAIEIYANDGFTHTDEPSTLTAHGAITYEQCRAFRCDGDGFNNSGVAHDVALACEATWCGPKWGEHVSPPAAPRARVIWVDSRRGDDASDGLSEENAVATLGVAGAIAREDDEIRLVRGSRFTGTWLARRGQYLTAWGRGARPRIVAGPRDPAVAVVGVRDVRIEGLHLTGSRAGVVAAGPTDGLEVVDCRVVDNRAGLIAQGTGAVDIHDSRFERNTAAGIIARGAVELVCVNVTAWGHDRAVGARGLDVDQHATAVVVASTFRRNAIGIRLGGSSASAYVVSTHVSESRRDAEGVGILVERADAAPRAVVANCVVCVPDPLTGARHHGVLAESDVAVLNCTFYNANSGATGTVSNAVTIGALATGSVVANCVFDDEGIAESRFIDVVRGVFVAIGNWYHTAALGECKWRVRGLPLGWIAWNATAGVKDQSVGGYSASSMVRGDPSDFPWNAAPAGLGGNAPRDGGVDLTPVFAAFGMPIEDFGRRRRGIDGSWAAGALEQRTYSPDGFTTHDSSAFRIVSCKMIGCGDGVHFTHLNVSGDETAVIDCEFRDILEVGLNGAINQNWETRDCTFVGCRRGAGGIRPAAGTTQVFESCLFVDCAEAAVHSDPVVPARIRLQNCVVVLPESIQFDEGFGVNVEHGPIGLDVFNSTIVMASLDTEDSTVYGLRCREGTIALYNNVFSGACGDDAYYVRVPTRGQITEADHNFYELGSLADVRWWCNGARDFTMWRALGRGQDGGATDSRGGAAARSLVAASGDARVLASDSYFVAPSSPAYAGGRPASPLFDRAWAAAPRATAGVWNTGPSALVTAAATISRAVAGRTRFDRFAVGPGSLDIRIADRSVEATGELVEIHGVSFARSAGVTAVIHEGPFPGTRVLWSGSLSGGPVVNVATFVGRAYADVYVSFVGAAADITGEIDFRLR